MNNVVDGVPLPADLAPISDTNTSMFSGIWAGKWDNVLNTILVVEAIDNNKAKVVYAVGANGRNEGAWFRYDAEITGDTLTMFDSRRTITFRLSKTGRLRAILGDGRGFGVLTRQDASTITSPDPRVSWVDGRSVRLETELREDGKPIRLENIIYRPSGDGPFPLAVVNHGSTGPSNDEAAAKETWENAWLADF